MKKRRATPLGPGIALRISNGNAPLAELDRKAVWQRPHGALRATLKATQAELASAANLFRQTVNEILAASARLD